MGEGPGGGGLIEEGIDLAIRLGWLRDLALWPTRRGHFEQYERPNSETATEQSVAHHQRRGTPCDARPLFDVTKSLTTHA